MAMMCVCLCECMEAKKGQNHLKNIHILANESIFET